MSHFSTALTEIIRRQAGSKRKFALGAGIGPTQITEYTNGGYRPTDAMLTRIVSALESEVDRTALVIAYVTDAIPEGWRERLIVVPKGS